MSFDLFVCDPPTHFDDDEVRTLFERAADGDESLADDGFGESTRIPTFLAALLAKYPALETLGSDAVDGSPWSVTPERGPAWVFMSMTWSAGEDVVSDVVALAESHGLVIFDPQDGSVFRPPA